MQARASATKALASLWRPAARQASRPPWHPVLTVSRCGGRGLRAAVCLRRPSSAELAAPHRPSQVDANLAAADIPLDLFDTIVSADAFEQLKPSPGAATAAASARAAYRPCVPSAVTSSARACSATRRYLSCCGRPAGRGPRQLRGN